MGTNRSPSRYQSVLGGHGPSAIVTWANIGLVYLLLSICYTQVHAVSCSSVASGDTASCYALPNCIYNWPTAQCVSGTPTVCTDYYTNVAGCTSGAVANCSMSTVGFYSCINKPASCRTLDGNSVSCRARSDCNYNTTSLACNIGPAPGSCATATTQQACNAKASSGCSWDYYLSACYIGSAEVLKIYPCSYWSAFPPDSGACSYHYCDLIGSTCMNTGTGDGMTDNSSTIAFTASTTWVNPRIVPGTNIFRVDVWRPVGLSFCNPGPFWPTYTVGLGSIDPSILMTPGFGSTAKATSDVPQCVYPTNPTAVQAAFAAFVQSNGTYNFDRGTVNGELEYRTAGPVAVGGTSLADAMGISPDGQSTIAYLVINMDTAVDQLASRGVTRYRGATQNNYFIPMAVIDQTVGGGVFSSNIQFSPTITTNYSSTMTIGSRNPTSLTFVYQKFIETATVNVFYMEYQLILKYSNVFDPTMIIGPRNMSDIVWRSPISATGPTNGYGAYLSSLQFIGCDRVQYTCSYRLTFRTLTRMAVASGRTFKDVNNAFDADRIALMGSDIPIPTTLNGIFNFFFNTWSHLNGTAASTDILINGSPLGYPDQGVVSIFQDLFPRVYTQGVLNVVTGFLPSAASPLTSMQALYSSLSGPIGTGMQLRNKQVRFNETLFVISKLNDTSLANLYDLRVPLSTIGILASGVTGTLLSSGPNIAWTDITACVTYVPKNQYDNCPQCQVVSQCIIDVKYCDVYGIPVACLWSKFSGKYNSFQITEGQDLSRGTTLAGDLPSGGSRRLLQDDSGNSVTVYSSSSGYTITIVDAPNSTVVIPIIADDQTTLDGGTSYVFVKSGSIVTAVVACVAVFASVISICVGGTSVI